MTAIVTGMAMIVDITDDQLFEIANLDIGRIEFMCELALYAPYCYALGCITDEHPGVYDYEVSGEFGAWFAEMTIRNESVPTRDMCRIALLNMAQQFYGGTVTDEQLMNVPFTL